MSDWLMRVIRAEAKNLIALAADDDELRAGLRALANEILAATEDPGSRPLPRPLEADVRRLSSRPDPTATRRT